MNEEKLLEYLKRTAARRPEGKPRRISCRLRKTVFTGTFWMSSASAG